MGSPGLIPGGATLSQTAAEASADDKKIYGKSRGVFGKHPGATLKTAINDGKGRDAEYRETMARLFIQMPAQERALFVKSVPPATRELAQVLCGVGEGASGGTGFVDFMLQNAVEDFQEKFQVVESLSDNFIVYVFGQRAVPFQYSGMLYNTYQDDQRVWMLRMYQDILRGTQLARRRKLVRLRYDSVIVSGIFLGLQQTLRGDLENGVPFSFLMQPTQYVIFSQAVGTPTQLQTPFTEGGQYALNSIKPPDTTQLRVAAQARAPLPSKKRQNEKTDSAYTTSIAEQVKKRKATEQLSARTTGGKPPPQTASEVRGKIVPK